MLDTLPLELVLLIVSHCDIPTGVALGMTCHYLFSCCLMGRFNMRVTFAGASGPHLWRNSRWDVIYDLIVHRGSAVPKTLFLNIAHTTFRLDHFVKLMRHLDRDGVAGLYEGVTNLHQVIERCVGGEFDEISFFHLMGHGYYSKNAGLGHARVNNLTNAVMVRNWLDKDMDTVEKLVGNFFETLPTFFELAGQDLIRNMFRKDWFPPSVKVNMFLHLDIPTSEDVVGLTDLLTEEPDIERYLWNLAQWPEYHDVLAIASDISVYLTSTFHYYANPYHTYQPGYLHDACYIRQVADHDPEHPDYIQPEFTVRVLMEDTFEDMDGLCGRGAQWFRGASSCAKIYHSRHILEEVADPIDILTDLFVGASDEFKCGACLVSMTYKWSHDTVLTIAHMVPDSQIDMAIEYCQGQGFDDYVSILKGRLETS